MRTSLSEKEKYLFETAPVPKAVAALVIPTVVSQLITIVYNLADTFFVGRLGDETMVAAITLCLPIFMLLTATANLFGIGGASVMSRALGAGDGDKARRAASFAIWGSVIAAAVVAVVFAAFETPLLTAFGAEGMRLEYAGDYLIYTVIGGAVPTVLSSVLAHLVRAEGKAAHAGIGLSLGGLLNVALDPLFIFDQGLGMGVSGAALATLLSNIASAVYFAAVVLSSKNSVVTFRRVKGAFGRAVSLNVLSIGLPACMMSLMTTCSNLTVNYLMAAYGDAAIAGIGVAKRINMASFAITQGITQGTLPLIGYNFSAGNSRRMRGTVVFMTACTLGFALISLTVSLCIPEQLIRAFIDDDPSVEYGARFLRIICYAVVSAAIGFVAMTVFQATGKKVRATVLSVLRKGRLDIPLMFILDPIFPATGIAMATPIADYTAAFVAIVLLVHFFSTQRKRADLFPSAAPSDTAEKPDTHPQNTR